MPRTADREPAIPDDTAPVPPAHRPTWWTVRTVRWIGSLLTGLAVLVAFGAIWLSYEATVAATRLAQQADEQSQATNDRLAVLEQDLSDRTAQRDAERAAAEARDAETRAQVSAYVCELLGQLPANDPALAQLRATLACAQPGLPLSSPLTEETPP